MSKKISSFLLLYFILFSTILYAQECSYAQEYNPHSSFSKASDSIVGIQAIHKRKSFGSSKVKDVSIRAFFNEQYPDLAGFIEGDCFSGVVVDEDGVVLTTLNLLDGADKIFVMLSAGTKKEADLLHKDERLNLALLKVDSRFDSVVNIANGVNIGEVVIAIGNPFGDSEFGALATSGIISGLNQRIPDKNYLNLIKTDAMINPFNNGGALLNSNSELVGINLYTEDAKGLYYALSVNSETIDRLKSRRHHKYGWIGMRVREEFRKREKEIIVVDVIDNGPADEAGFKQDDILRLYNGKAVESVVDLSKMVAMSEVGSRVSVNVLRDKKEINLYLNIEAKPSKKK